MAKIIIETISKTLLFFLIFGMSATVETSNLKRQINNKFAIASGVLMQFIVMPLLGFLSVSMLSRHLTSAMGITLLIVTSSPGGSFSNWFCSMFNADLALSVTMTALSTLLSTFLLPLNLIVYTMAAYGRSSPSTTAAAAVTADELEKSILASVDWKDLFITLAVVILAIAAGLVAAARFPTIQFKRWANRFGSLSGLALVVFTFLLGTLTGGGGAEGGEEEVVNSKLWNQSPAFYVGVALPCVLGLIIANLLTFVTRLSHPERVTISVECCYQNVGIATSAAVSMFDDTNERAQAICVPLFYGVVEAVLLGIYCIIAWKLGWTKAPKDENFCVILSKTYEVNDKKDDHLIIAVQDDDECESLQLQPVKEEGGFELTKDSDCTSDTEEIPMSELESSPMSPRSLQPSRAQDHMKTVDIDSD